MSFSFIISKAIEDIDDNIKDKKNDKKKYCDKFVDNFIDNNFEIEKDFKELNKLTSVNLFNNVSAKIQHIEKYDGGFKISFDLKENEKNNLLGVDTKNIQIFIKSNDELVNDVFTTWFDVQIINGMTLYDIKKSFLKYNRFYTNSDPFSFSIKLNKKFDINRKIKIFLKYNPDNLIDNSGKNEEIIIPVKNYKDEEEFTLFSLIYSDFDKYNELYEIINDNCTCSSVYNKENSLKLIFPENDKLINNKFRDLLKLYVEDENGIEINDVVFLKWVGKEKITNGTLLKDIKKSFFVLYKENKYNTAQKPYQVSMFFDKSKYKKVKIKIKYNDNKSFYIKNNGSEIIDLDNLEKQNIIGNNIKKFNDEKNDKLTEDEFKNKFKELIAKGITCEKVGKFKNSFKIVFNVDNSLIGESYRNNIKIQYFDEKDNLLTESLFHKWKSDVEIKNNMRLSDIKAGFLYKFPQYDVPVDKLFEISMFINKNIKNKKVKIKISYNDDFGEFVKFNNSEIIDLNNFK